MAIRFHPPPLVPAPEVRWMLLRAFGPVGAPFPETAEPAAALRLARRFEVSARIAALQGRERLAAEVGAETAAGFGHDRLAAAAAAMRLTVGARRVAEVAASRDIPLAFLKFAALEGTGLLAAGSRNACDIDVLAPEERTRELWQALTAAGWSGGDRSGYEHQLPALASAEGGTVEVHRVLLGVRLDGRASAGWESLDRHGLLESMADLPGRCAAPVPEVLAAHVLVHGVGQHGFFPAAYSPLKMVADLLDLGLDAALSPRALAWVARDVSPEEGEAVRRLCSRLAAGEDPAGWTGPEEVLLRHILAGRLDPDYEKALRLGLFRAQPSDRPPVLRLARAVWDAVALDDAQIDALYGPPRSRLGYLGRRLARPFDLLWRLGRYGVRWLRVRGGLGS